MSRASVEVGAEINTAAKQATSSGIRMKPSRKGDQLIDFFVAGVVIFFVFIFCWIVELR
jgi:hypothetical protein